MAVGIIKDRRDMFNYRCFLFIEAESTGTVPTYIGLYSRKPPERIAAWDKHPGSAYEN
jgi:hypothetical protein